MKIMTKEWIKDMEFHDLIVMLEPNTNKYIPFVFTNGGTEGVAKEDLYTVKTNFDFSEKENEISFVMLPDTYEFDVDFLESGTINEKSCRTDFLIQYLNNLRIISYIPENILKGVKDRRLLALGYAEKEAKKEILKYIKSKYRKAFDFYEKSADLSVEAESGLTIHKQFDDNFFSHSVTHMFDGAKITKAKKIQDEIYLTLDDRENIVFSGAEIIEEEVDILNSYVNEIELYNNGECYELHLLIEKVDDNFIKHYYYATYAFKDLKFGN